MMPAIVVGAGPAGLMAAEQLIDAGLPVAVYEQMPTAGRKLLRAGIGGLNITHSEPSAAFLQRYSRGRDWLAPQLAQFGAAELIQFFHELGIDTFVGSSGRVFPIEKKAAPFLRRWLARLREKGVQFYFRHRLVALDDHTARFVSAAGEHTVEFAACVLALGGGSWAELGSDGLWQSMLAEAEVALQPLLPSNMGFTARAAKRSEWSAPIRQLAGQPLKQIRFQWRDAQIQTQQRSAIGECVITEHGLEGSLIYACSSAWRELVLANGSCAVAIDLLPQFSREQVLAKLQAPRKKLSLSAYLRKVLSLDSAKLALLYECEPMANQLPASELASALKALPLVVTDFAKAEHAISTAGGVALNACDQAGRLHALPKVFCCGEMLDWDAPTGGYLLTACFANGRAVGQAAAMLLSDRSS